MPNHANLRPWLGLLVATALVLGAHRAAAAPDKLVDVAIRINGDEVTVDVDCFVAASPEEAWSVMTDYDHATSFISHLEKSAVLSRSADRLFVAQKGTMGYGPFSVTFETMVEILLSPFEKMQARLIRGNLRKYETTTRLVRDGTGTRIVHHLESIPEIWIPPLIGRLLIEHETRGRFEQLLDEILRRKSASGAAKGLVPRTDRSGRNRA